MGAASESGAGLYTPVSVALELEWVLRSRLKMNKAPVEQTFVGLLQTVTLHFAAAGALKGALDRYEKPGADFADCMHTALASLLGETPMRTFDKQAARLHGAALLT